jgi:hypothetical protein
LDPIPNIDGRSATLTVLIFCIEVESKHVDFLVHVGQKYKISAGKVPLHSDRQTVTGGNRNTHYPGKWLSMCV